MDPGEKSTANGLLPGNLKDAISILANDPLMKDMLGEEFTKIYTTVQKNEWNNYMMQGFRLGN